MKKYLSVITAILFIGGMASLAAAQAAPFFNPGSLPLLSWGVPQGNSFQNFLSTHPNVAAQLQSNPNLLYDPNWRHQHPDLQRYVGDHKQVWKGIMAKGGIDPKEEQWWNFLSAHPRAQRELAANPNLFYDPRWRAQHPDIQNYLKTHPGARSRLLSLGPSNVAPRSWQDFVRQHPNLGEIQNNPALIQDPNYLRRNSALQQYLGQHPGVREDLIERSRWQRERRDPDDWRWRHAWNDRDEDQDEGYWRHPPGHAYGWERHPHYPPGHAYGWERHEEREEREAHAHGHGPGEPHGRGPHGHGGPHGDHDRD